jgi:hypothetical protein
MGKTGWRNGYTGSWRVDFTQEAKDSMEESRNRHQGFLGRLHGEMRRKVKSEEIGKGVSSVQGVKTRENWTIQFLKPDRPILPEQTKPSNGCTHF